MKTWLLTTTCALVSTVPALHAVDDFNVQMSKVMQEGVSLDHDIYTQGKPAGMWEPKSDWFQKPSVSFRFNATHREMNGGYSSTDLFTPMADFGFQTFGGVNVGIAYAHGFLSDDQPFYYGGGTATPLGGDMNSVGAYVAKQWDCGFKIGATWSYSSADYRLKIQYLTPSYSTYEFDTMGASGALGFARSFGEKKVWKNLFVDTSANFLYQSEEEVWYFLWMAKVGHAFGERVSVYGIFNLYDALNDAADFPIPLAYGGYQTLSDSTWGEAGGGIQTQLGAGLTLTMEATTSVLNDAFMDENGAFQVRAWLNWKF